MFCGLVGGAREQGKALPARRRVAVVLAARSQVREWGRLVQRHSLRTLESTLRRYDPRIPKKILILAGVDTKKHVHVRGYATLQP